MFSKTLSLDIASPYNLLISENISRFYIWKAKAASKTWQLALMLSIYTEVNVYFNTWTKFLLNNRPPSKLPPHWSPLFIRMFGSRECYMHLNAVFHPGVILNKWFLYYSHQRKQPTFRDATVGSTWKWRLTNERRNSILMTYQYQDLGSASGPSRSKAEKRYPLNK